MKKLLKMMMFCNLFFCATALVAQKNIFFPSLIPISKEGKVKNQKLHSTNIIDVFVFYSPDCPICKTLVPDLNELHEKFKDQPIEFYIVLPQSLHYTKKEISNNEIIDSLDLNIYIDKKNKLVKQLNATVTPQVIVVKDSKILYAGMVNDLYQSVGVQKKSAVQYFLLDALTTLMANNEALIKHTTPVGCYINQTK